MYGAQRRHRRLRDRRTFDRQMLLSADVVQKRGSNVSSCFGNILPISVSISTEGLKGSVEKHRMGRSPRGWLELQKSCVRTESGMLRIPPSSVIVCSVEAAGWREVRVVGFVLAMILKLEATCRFPKTDTASLDV